MDLSAFSERGAKDVLSVRRQAEPNEKDDRAVLFGGSSLTPTVLAPTAQKNTPFGVHSINLAVSILSGTNNIAHHIQAERY